MKNLALGLLLMLLVASCAPVTHLPVSDITPAATIDAKKSQDKNGNYVISVDAKNLASPDRLPQGNKSSVYVVWIKTKADEIKNLGQLKNKNAQKAGLKTISAFEPVEIFITAEEQGNVQYPSGTEITRGTFK